MVVKEIISTFATQTKNKVKKDCLLPIRMKKRFYFVLLTAFVAVVNVSGQYRYCLSYQDFCNNKWEELDNLHFTQRTKNEQMWWGGNVFTVTCDKEPIDKILKKQAFAVMYYDSIYVNCYNLWFQDDRLGKGYVKARRIGNRSLIFVNRTIGQEARGGQNMATFFMFGAIGAAIASASDSKRLMKQQVCYIISKGADEKGRIEIRMVNDDLISKMLNDNGELLREYYDEEEEKLRIHASRVMPILQKSGLIK